MNKMCILSRSILIVIIPLGEATLFPDLWTSEPRKLQADHVPGPIQEEKRTGLQTTAI